MNLNIRVNVIISNIGSIFSQYDMFLIKEHTVLPTFSRGDSEKHNFSIDSFFNDLVFHSEIRKQVFYITAQKHITMTKLKNKIFWARKLIYLKGIQRMMNRNEVEMQKKLVGIFYICEN